MSPDQADVPPPKRSSLAWGTKVIATAALLCSALAVAGVSILISENRSERASADTAQAKAQVADAESKDLASDIDRICKTSTKEARNLRVAGKCEQAKQVIEREGPPGPPGQTGAAGRPPTASEVANAVASFCGLRNQCRGPAGVVGVAGKNAPLPTAAQVAQAVATYCNAKGECKGPVGKAGEVGEPGKDASPAKDGVDGKNGNDGAQGSTGAQGEAGPAPTQTQIDAAVLSYCTDNGCKGPKGDTGDAGAQGPDSSLVACTAAGGTLQEQAVLSDALTTIKILVCVIP